MLRRNLTLGIVLTLLSSSVALAKLEKNDVVRREIDLAPGATTVVVDNVFGSVHVEAGAAGKVTVEIRRHVEARRAELLDAAMNEVTLAVEPDGDRLELAQDGPFRCHDRRGASWGRHSHWGGCGDWDPDYDVSWEWRVEVPAGIDLEVSNVNDGAVEVEGIEGRVEASNVNGGLRLSGLVGELDASTVNGDLSAEFASAPRAAASLHTVNGEIELGLPAGSNADIGLKTMNGEMYSDFEVTSIPQEAKTERSRRGGRSYRLDRDAVVRIGAGGPRLDCETLNGDIVVRSR